RFFVSSRRRHTRFSRDWSSDVCSSDLGFTLELATSFDLSYACRLPPNDTSLYNDTVHSDAPGMVRIRYLPLGTLMPSTVTSSEKVIAVPPFAPVRQRRP